MAPPAMVFQRRAFSVGVENSIAMALRPNALIPSSPHDGLVIAGKRKRAWWTSRNPASPNDIAFGPGEMILANGRNQACFSSSALGASLLKSVTTTQVQRKTTSVPSLLQLPCDGPTPLPIAEPPASCPARPAGLTTQYKILFHQTPLLSGKEADWKHGRRTRPPAVFPFHLHAVPALGLLQAAFLAQVTNPPHRSFARSSRDVSRSFAWQIALLAGSRSLAPLSL